MSPSWKRIPAAVASAGCLFAATTNPKSIRPISWSRPAEGPIWFADLNCLLVSDVPNHRILRWTEDFGVSVFRGPSGFANCHYRDRQGRLVGCSHRHRGITSTEIDGRITVLADRYEGKRLSSPNDICTTDGTIWFSDLHLASTRTKRVASRNTNCPLCSIVLIRKTAVCASWRMTLSGRTAWPSHRMRLLYVAETGRQFDANPTRLIRVFDVQDGGRRLSGGRVFHTTSPGYADGCRVDEDGNVWTSAETVSTASHRTAASSASSRCRSRYRT
jgi:gluconolactonase